MSVWERVAESPFGNFIIGLLLLALGPTIFVILNAMNPTLVTTVGNETVDLTVAWNILKIAVPFFLVISGLRKMGVKL